MKISLTKAGKRFNRDWIFRNLSYEFNTGTAYAITGPNGSGKSTLLQSIGGAIALSEGSVDYHLNQGNISNNHAIDPNQLHQHISISAPYLELIEEMTAKEMLLFHQQFKPLLPGAEIEQILSLIGLKDAVSKQIRYFSSGMKQRLKLAQALFSEVPVVLLDEPCTNLDASGIELYHQLIQEYGQGRLLIVSSNDETEYSHCREKLNILDFK